MFFRFFRSIFLQDIVDGDGVLYVGARDSTGLQAFSGTLQDVRTYSTMLDARYAVEVYE